MTSCTTNAHAASDSHTAGASVLRRILLSLEAMRQRRKLSELDADRLSDMGLSPADVAREVSRKPWDVPQHWLR